MDKAKHALWIGSIIGSLIGSLMTQQLRNHYWRSEAIEHGAAYYHPETGEFTWRREESYGD